MVLFLFREIKKSADGFTTIGAKKKKCLQLRVLRVLGRDAAIARGRSRSAR